MAKSGLRCSCLTWQTSKTTPPTKLKFSLSLNALSLWRCWTSRVRIGSSRCPRLSVDTCPRRAHSLSSLLVCKSPCARRTIATTGGPFSSPRLSARKTPMKRTLKLIAKKPRKLLPLSSECCHSQKAFAHNWTVAELNPTEQMSSQI